MKKIVAMMLVFSLLLSVSINYVCIKGQVVSSDANESTDVWEEDDEDFIETEGAEEDEAEMEDDPEDEDTGEEEDDEIIVDTKILETWENHYNAEVTVTNVSDRRIDDWEMSFQFNDTIEHIWNGQIVEKEEGFYTIKNAGWNQDIAAGGSVTFGMTVKCEGEKDTIRDYYLTRECFEVEENRYELSYEQYSRWDNKVNGRIVIKNISDERIEDWKLGLSSNLMFEQIWCAEIVDDGAEEVIENMQYNQNIESGQEVSFGFIAVCDDEQVEIYDDTLYEMIPIPEELEGDPDWVDEYELGELAQYDLERDDFETEEAYQEYVVKRKALGYEVVVEDINYEDDDDEEYQLYPPEVQMARKKAVSTGTGTIVDTPIKKNYKLKESAVECKIINAGSKAIQSYYKDGKYLYAVQRYSWGIKITKCTKRKITKDNEKLKALWNIKKGDWVYDLKGKNKSVMELKGFQHGQTMELFSYDGKIYMLVTAGSIGDKCNWGNQLCILKFKKGTLNFKEVSSEKIHHAMYLGKLSCANKSRESKGTITHAEAALSENEKTLLIWGQMGGKIQLTCYRMSDLMPKLLKIRKNADKKKKGRATLGCDKIPKKSVICSAMQSKKKGNFGKPLGSFQGIDMANQANDAYELFVSGGNDNKGYKSSIMRCNITKSGNSVLFTPCKIKSTFIGLSEKKEMEGIHYQNGKVSFLMTPFPKEDKKIKIGGEEKKVKLDKNVQILFTIPASELDGGN